MPVSRAVILAAGRGTRLSGAGPAVPKGLIEIGGEALVSRSIRQLAARGITEVSVVTGHQSELYEAFAAQRSGMHCIYNKNFDVMGSLESLKCALAVVAPPFLLLDSDIIYESRGLDVLMKNPAANGALVSDLTGSGDEYYVWTGNASRIHHFSKSLADKAAAPAGEHIGILKIGEALGRALLAKAPEWLLAKPLDAYESLLVSLLPDHPVESAHVPDLLWSEIDNAAMLNTARNIIWPGLMAKGDG